VVFPHEGPTIAFFPQGFCWLPKKGFGICPITFPPARGWVMTRNFPKTKGFLLVGICPLIGKCTLMGIFPLMGFCPLAENYLLGSDPNASPWVIS
jgi:hypothetical protein